MTCVDPRAHIFAAAGPSFSYKGMPLDRGDEIHRYVALSASSWRTASAHCAAQGMFLATIRDQAQWNTIRGQLRGCAIGGITTVAREGVFDHWYWADTPNPQNHRFSAQVAVFGSSFPIDNLGLWNIGWWVWTVNQPSQFGGGGLEDRLMMRADSVNDVHIDTTADSAAPPDTRFGSAACVRFRCNSVDDCNGNADDGDGTAAVQYFNRSLPCSCRCKEGFSGPTCWHDSAAEGGDRYFKFTGTYQNASFIGTACGGRHPYMYAASAGSSAQFNFMAAYGGDGCQVGASGAGAGAGSGVVRWIEGRLGSTPTSFTLSTSGVFSAAVTMHYRLKLVSRTNYALVTMGAARLSLCYLCAVQTCTVESDCAMHAAGSVIAVDGLWPNCSCTVLNQNDELTRLSFLSLSVAAPGLVDVTGDTRADAEATIAASPHNHSTVAEPSLSASNSPLPKSPPAWRGTQPLQYVSRSRIATLPSSATPRSGTKCTKDTALAFRRGSH